jgi:pyruvate dehydrogenase E2 component (dihydrolipoamide acetyltransferase)
MAEIVRMPKMSDTMTEGTVAVWHKKVGDTIKSGDVVAEVETDKATMDLEAYESGTILYIGIQAGQSAAVDGILYIVGKPNENYEALLGESSQKNEIVENKTSDINSDINKVETPQPPAATVVENLKTENTNAVQNGQIKAKVERMPKMSDTMTEGVVVAWHKKVGETVKAGELLAEIETDKAVMELEAYEAGTILYLGVAVGGKVAVDAILYIIGEPNADYKTLLSGNGSQTEQSNKTNSQETQQNPPTNSVQEPKTESTNSNGSHSDERVKISPLAKQIAKDLGYNLDQIKGSGDGGRIVKADVENFKPATKSDTKQEQPQESQKQQEVKAVSGTNVVNNSSNSNPFGESYEEVAVSQMRKTIARRLAESKFSAPEFYLTLEIEMDNAMAARQRMNEISDVKISFNDIVLKATAVALKQHPKVNSSWLGDKIRINHHVNIGVAMAVEDGLLVPVVRMTDMKSLSQIAKEVKDFSQKAKDKKLQPKDWEGSTFTISNLGMFGIDEFTAIINPPDACILAVGGIKEMVVVKKGEMKIANIMKVTLTCDHRVVDGATGAEFLKTLKANIEEPLRLLV